MPVDQNTIKNRLLGAIPHAELAALFPDLQPVKLIQKSVILTVEDPIDNVYFIEEGLVSILTMMANGTTIEVGMVGIEGMVGTSALLGSTFSGQHVIVQAPGTALRMNAAKFKAAFDERPAIRAIVHRFIDAFMHLSSQTAACNRLHTIEQRCARWLLMAADRSQSDMLPMTHEFLASLLGVRRSGVTMIAGELQQAGFIRYNRGNITITDHDGLIAAACECYKGDHDRFIRLIMEQTRKKV